MQAAVLSYEWLAVDADDVVVWESLAKLLLCLLVCIDVAISRHQNSSVCDEEVSVGGWQPSAVFVEDSLCHRQWDELIGIAFHCAERLQLRFHLLQLSEVLVTLVETLHISNRVIRTEAGQRVDMTVCIVASKVAVVEPKDALSMKHFEQSSLDLFLCQRLVAMRREQTFACRQDGPLAVALYAATFEHKVKMVFVLALHNVLLYHPLIDLVIEVSRELLSPAVELEIEQVRTVWSKQSDEAMIASPSVVGRRLAE